MVTEETVFEYLRQIAHSGRTVRDSLLKRNAFIDSLQSGASTFLPRGVAQAVACDGQVYTVNYDNPQPGTKTNPFTLFEDKKQQKIHLKVCAGHITSYFGENTRLTYIKLRISVYLDTYFNTV